MPADVSIVVPARNAGAYLPPLVEVARGCDELGLELVVVDDASTDATLKLLELAHQDALTVIPLGRQVGAGAARNVGFDSAAGRYTLFFDADDTLHPSALVHAVKALDGSGADLAMTNYRYDDGTGRSSGGMLPPDVEIWSHYMGAANDRVVRLADVPRLLEFTNYPWNKVLRTEVFQSQGLRFGETPVHNDIRGHWGSLLSADRIQLLNQPICTHVVRVGGRHLTNLTSEVRLALFDALDETYDDLLADYPDRRRLYSAEYWRFVMKTAAWAEERTPASHRERFRMRLQEHLLRVNLGDYARLQRQDRGLARSIAARALS